MFKDNVLLAHDVRKQAERLGIDNMQILHKAKEVFAEEEYDNLVEVYKQEEQDLLLIASLVEKDRIKDAELLAKNLHTDIRDGYIPGPLAEEFGWKNKGNSYIIK